MAIVKIQFQCGCRFKTEMAQRAVQHVEKTGHTVTISGEIRPGSEDQARKEFKGL